MRRAVCARARALSRVLAGVLCAMAAGFTADMHRDCQLMLERFDRECNTTNFTASYAEACSRFTSSREYRRIYYRVQYTGRDCFVQR